MRLAGHLKSFVRRLSSTAQEVGNLCLGSLLGHCYGEGIAGYWISDRLLRSSSR